LQYIAANYNSTCKYAVPPKRYVFRKKITFRKSIRKHMQNKLASFLEIPKFFRVFSRPSKVSLVITSSYVFWNVILSNNILAINKTRLIYLLK